jgi:hypothetical protein
MKRPVLQDGHTLGLLVSDVVVSPRETHSEYPRRDTKIHVVTLHGEKMTNLSSDDESGWSDLTVIQRSYPEFESNCFNWDLRFEQVYCMDLRKSACLYHALRDITKALDRLDREWGISSSLGVYAVRLAKVLGVATIVTWREHPFNLNYKESAHLRRYHTPGEAVRVIDYPIQVWLAEERAKIKAAAAA